MHSKVAETDADVANAHLASRFDVRHEIREAEQKVD